MKNMRYQQIRKAVKMLFPLEWSRVEREIFNEATSGKGEHEVKYITSHSLINMLHLFIYKYMELHQRNKTFHMRFYEESDAIVFTWRS